MRLTQKGVPKTGRGALDGKLRVEGKEEVEIQVKTEQHMHTKFTSRLITANVCSN